MKALITGATRGIGKAIAECLAKEVYEIVLVARSEADLITLAGELVEKGSPYVEYVAVDLSTSKGRADLIGSLEGDLDLLVNNIGLFHEVNADQISSGVLHEQMCANVYPAIDLSHAVLDSMKAKSSGSIVFIGSIVSETNLAYAAAYTLTKSLLSNYVEMIREELKSSPIRISEIIPTAVNTSSWEGIQAPKDQFLQTTDIVEAFKSIIFAHPNVSVDRIQISSKILEK